MLVLFLWSWGESNSRPDKAPQGFLHVYSPIEFSRTGWTGKTTSRYLISINFANNSSHLFAILFFLMMHSDKHVQETYESSEEPADSAKAL